MQPALAPAPHPMQNAAQFVISAQALSIRELDAEQFGADVESIAGLREHLLAQVQSPQSSAPSNIENMRPSSSASPHDQNIDPAIAGSGLTLSGTSAESGGDDNNGYGSTKKGGKRELSTSKRAAQNRAAQRAFRQRKEGHIKKLEEQVRDLHALEENYKAIQAENYQLRDYIINLQSRLIETQGELPPPPLNIDLNQPRHDTLQHHGPAPTAPMGASAVSQLQASAAQAVADLGSGKHHHEEAAYLTGDVYPSKRQKNGESVGIAPGPESGTKLETNGNGI
ncbi:hypothetical protein FGG08_002038 [Glutinoglossum americanum]|uniref:Putative transcription factor kapC n=1 Tax=Glutinoglossum americanum TaxID=1670608 RepID=A0A9P8L4V4_9PEZI|nr:hypothetical protein FGG08_002038 [Glutinoglossum americanum]